MYGAGAEIGPAGRLQLTLRSRGEIVGVFPHPNDGPPEIAGVAQRPGIDYFVKPAAIGGSDDNDGLGIGRAVATFTYALSLVTDGRGDRIFASPGEYAEAEVDVNKADVEIIGNGPLGSVVIKPGTGIEGMKITASDVTLKNINIEGDSTANYALSVGTFADEVARFRAFGCKFELGEGSNETVRLIGCSDVHLEGNQFCWADIGIMFRGGSISYPTQIKIINNDFHNLAVQWLAQRENPSGSDNGKVVNLRLIGNSFDNLEVGTAPTGVSLELDHVGSTGIVGGNMFAIATNDSAKLAIASGIMWGPNGTETGWSTVRPS